MNYYTRQQMEGSVRYVPRVLVGNWNEDQCVEETILKDFLAKKEHGDLKIDRYEAPLRHFAQFPSSHRRASQA
jgi:hypothetical protein